MSRKQPFAVVLRSAAETHAARTLPRTTHGAPPSLPEDVQNTSRPTRVTPRRKEFSEEALQREIDEMFKIYETLGPGWDDHDAKPVNKDSLSDAREFLSLRPKGIRLPHPQIDPDGVVGLWWKTPRGFAGVDFEGNGLLSYYARLGARFNASKKFLADDHPYRDGWPEELLAVLRKI